MIPLRCRARVLRTWPLGETSLIVLLLSKEQGLRRAVAKGARGARSPFRGLLEPGTPLDLQIYIKPRGDLHLLKEVSLAGRLPRPARKLETLALRLAGLELVMLTQREVEAQPELFFLLEDYLSVFDADDDDDEAFFAPFFAFEASLLELHGLLPDPGRCCVSGRELAPGPLRFLPGEGLFADPACGREGIDLDSGEADWLKSLFLARPSELRGRSMPDPVQKKMGRVLHIALSCHLPGYRLPRALDVLRGGQSGGDEDRTNKESSK